MPEEINEYDIALTSWTAAAMSERKKDVQGSQTEEEAHTELREEDEEASRLE